MVIRKSHAIGLLYVSVHNTPLQQTGKDLMTATGVSY